jgi:two-component system sensor histidine kinase PilS (NtrC family)
MQAADPIAAEPREDELNADAGFARRWRGFMTARVGIGTIVLTFHGGLYVLVPALNISGWLVVLCGAYLFAALVVRLFARPLPPGHSFDPQWVSTIGVDLVAFAALQLLHAAGVNYAPLFALPVLMASVLGSALLALGTAAGVTLVLLADAWIIALDLAGDSYGGSFLQAGLTGTGYFALAVVVNHLAARLIREERAARMSEQAAKVQAQVNELVIETLAEGVLVVDAECRVQAANPAARALLGLGQPPGGAALALTAQPQWRQLVATAQLTFAQRAAQLGELAIAEPGAGARHMQVRTRLTSSHESQSLCVIFLQDLRELEARLRTEKLAAMGRMSAAVAHEFRNPLAAIAQANALMEEDLQEPALRQLSSLVRKNAQRLAQIVDEILDIARVRGQAASGALVIELDAAVAAACGDWCAQAGCGPRVALALGADGARVPFEPDHLRRVLVNLLDNALRYAGEAPGSIRVETRLAGPQASLHVLSNGAPLEATVQRHLFEPFFSSESRSSGLGLFICRELCERHAASIAYRRCTLPSDGGVTEGNEFAVSFAPAASPLAGTASFDTITA